MICQPLVPSGLYLASCGSTYPRESGFQQGPLRTRVVGQIQTRINALQQFSSAHQLYAVSVAILRVADSKKDTVQELKMFPLSEAHHLPE